MAWKEFPLLQQEEETPKSPLQTMMQSESPLLAALGVERKPATQTDPPSLFEQMRQLARLRQMQGGV